MNIRDLIKQLRYTAEVLEQFIGSEVMQEREWKAAHEDEQGLGKTLAMLSGPKFPTREEFLKKWTGNPVPYRWSSKPVNKKQEEGRMKRKYTKLHWTKRPENKEKLAKIIKKMQRAKKAKMNS